MEVGPTWATHFIKHLLSKMGWSGVGVLLKMEGVGMFSVSKNGASMHWLSSQRDLPLPDAHGSRCTASVLGLSLMSLVGMDVPLS